MLAPNDRYVVKACSIPDIPEDYQCAKLLIPYNQPAWIENKAKGTDFIRYDCIFWKAKPT